MYTRLLNEYVELSVFCVSRGESHKCERISDTAFASLNMWRYAWISLMWDLRGEGLLIKSHMCVYVCSSIGMMVKMVLSDG